MNRYLWWSEIVSDVCTSKRPAVIFLTHLKYCIFNFMIWINITFVIVIFYIIELFLKFYRTFNPCTSIKFSTGEPTYSQLLKWALESLISMMLVSVKILMTVRRDHGVTNMQSSNSTRDVFLLAIHLSQFMDLSSYLNRDGRRSSTGHSGLMALMRFSKV